MGIVQAVADIFGSITALVTQGRYVRTQPTLDPTLKPNEFQRQNHTATIIIGGLLLAIVVLVIAAAITAAKRK